jgi:hypothetical protein
MKSIWRFTFRILKLFLYLALALTVIVAIGVQLPMTEAPTVAAPKDVLITDITVISPETGQGRLNVSRLNNRLGLSTPNEIPLVAVEIKENHDGTI